MEGLEEDGLGVEWPKRPIAVPCVVSGRCDSYIRVYSEIYSVEGGRGRCAKRSTYTSSAGGSRVGRCAHWLCAFSVRIFWACLVVVLVDLEEESSSEGRRRKMRRRLRRGDVATR